MKNYITLPQNGWPDGRTYSPIVISIRRDVPLEKQVSDGHLIQSVLLRFV